MTRPKNVLYFAENALSAIQGGGIVAYAVLKGLPADQLLGFFEYRNITPVPEYADRFTFLAGWRTPAILHGINRLTRGRTVGVFHRLLTEQYIRQDFEFVQKQIEKEAFVPEVVYFAGLSYRYLRLAVMAAEHYDLPMVQLNMDDWVTVQRNEAGPRWGNLWYRRTIDQLTKASARSLVSTSNSPRLAAKLSDLTGYRHVPANNCCSDLMPFVTDPTAESANNIPVIVYAGAMNNHLQGETVGVLGSAVSELNAEGVRVHLHIYTPWEFAPAANSIAVPNAVFYKGQVSRERLADVYRQADFLVTTVTHRDGNIPLFRHSLSTKLSEYLCVGKPVISMGHPDWHMHEYVQDHGCGFSITMDEDYSRAAIKEKLRRILATSPATLARIGRRNRELWVRAHDTAVMARDTRRALGLEPVKGLAPIVDGPRGVVWVGGGGHSEADRWVPLAKLKSICRRLFDVFEHRTVDLVGVTADAHPQIDELASYCRDIGLEPTVLNDRGITERSDLWDPVGARWSLDAAQRHTSGGVEAPQGLFEQVAKLRKTATEDTPAQRAINQLSVRVSDSASHKPAIWFYGSTAVGRELISAIKKHAWLGEAVRIGGFISSPGYCKADLLHGLPWKAIDTISTDAVDFIVVTSETSRLAIQEELSRAGLLDRLLPLFGMAGRTPACGYERLPGGPGQAFVAGSSARDYARREFVARTGTRLRVPIVQTESAGATECAA